MFKNVPIILLPILLILFCVACNSNTDNADQSTSTTTKNWQYVDPHFTRNGNFVSGHLRKSVSIKPNAARHRASSRYYYHTHTTQYKQYRHRK